MRIIGFIFLLAIILLGISFAALNSTRVTINYYVGAKELSLSLLLVITLAIGAVLGLLISAWAMLKIKTQNFQLKKRLKLAEKEVENLRTIPLSDKH